MENKVPIKDVKHPQHYKLEGLEIEAKEVIRSVLNSASRSGYEAYCLGNAMKYLLRAGRKENEKQDLAKAREYLNFILDDEKKI